jgi:CO dehydrogenase nickel-insertion accessory protein CooC1
MSLRVAVAGKGGTGKTTLSAALVRVCLEAQAGPVLAVDADPNSNFSLCLGLAESTSLADIREEKDVPAGMSKLEYMNLRVQECLSEGRGVDLICMGRPEGPGCYCAVNHLLRNELSKLQHAYPVVIIDNEAGMEHLSRRTRSKWGASCWWPSAANPSRLASKTSLRQPTEWGELSSSPKIRPLETWLSRARVFSKSPLIPRH